MFKDNVERFNQLPEKLEILNDDLAYEHKAVIESAEAKEIFKTALDILPLLKGEGDALFDDFVNQLKLKVKAKGKNLFMPLRIALTGKEHGPELKRIFPIFGWVLIVAGVVIIGWTIYSSHNVFTGKAPAPTIFEMPKTVAKTAAPKGSIASLEDIQGQLQTMLGDQLKGLLPSDTIPKILNLTIWGILAWLLFLYTQVYLF